MDRLVSSGVWTEIAKITRKANRVRAAVAYVTQPKPLHLNKGDCLITDASDASIRAGRTSARALRGLQRRGVQVRSLPDLHAKVIVTDRYVIVGSANASVSSADQLVEAAIISDSRTAPATAQSFLVQLEEQSELLIPKKLSALCRLPVAVRAHGQKRAAKRPSIRLGGSNAWFCRVRDLVDAGSAAEAKAVERAEGIVERRFGVEEPSYLRWVGRSTFRARARGGDLMVGASSRRRGQTPYAVSPPLAILYRQDKDHWTRFYYAEELGRPMRYVTWAQFKRLAKAVGLSVSRSRPIAGRELSDLLRIWPRDGEVKR